jgi:hypothetical protein
MNIDLIDKTTPLETQEDHNPSSNAGSMHQLRQFADGRLIATEDQYEHDKRIVERTFDVSSPDAFEPMISKLREYVS